MPPTAVLSHALDPAALRAARRAAGLTLDAAGRAVGKEMSVIARYERGEVDPPTSVTVRLAELYQVEISSFVTPRTTQ